MADWVGKCRLEIMFIYVQVFEKKIFLKKVFRFSQVSGFFNFPNIFNFQVFQIYNYLLLFSGKLLFSVIFTQISIIKKNSTLFPRYVSIIACPAGWTSVEAKCFQIFNLPKSWNQAASSCKALGGRLAHISNKFINDWISKRLRLLKCHSFRISVTVVHICTHTKKGICVIWILDLTLNTPPLKFHEENYGAIIFHA